MEDRYLEHYGILGMKWGIRRTPEQLGHHKIKKGTTMYRVTPNSGESLSGKKYVTYLPPDRDFYRGKYLHGIRNQYGLSPDTKMYEKSYETTEELNIPSRETLKRAYAEVMKDDKTKEQALRDYTAKMLEREEADMRFNYDNWDKIKENYIKEIAESWIKDYDNSSVDIQFTTTVRAMTTTDPAIQQKVIDLLAKQGYNAMVDEAGVGSNRSGREGVEPIIIFDGSKSLNNTGVSAIDSKTQSKATSEREKWERVARANARKGTPW